MTTKLDDGEIDDDMIDACAAATIDACDASKAEALADRIGELLQSHRIGDVQVVLAFVLAFVAESAPEEMPESLVFDVVRRIAERMLAAAARLDAMH